MSAHGGARGHNLVSSIPLKHSLKPCKSIVQRNVRATKVNTALEERLNTKKASSSSCKTKSSQFPHLYRHSVIRMSFSLHFLQRFYCWPGSMLVLSLSPHIVRMHMFAVFKMVQFSKSYFQIRMNLVICNFLSLSHS